MAVLIALLLTRSEQASPAFPVSAATSRKGSSNADRVRLRTRKLLRSDMRLPHEAHPNGVPASYDWAAGPRPGRRTPPEGFSSFTAWGQVYACRRRGALPQTRVEIRKMQTWVLRDGAWREAQHSERVTGAAFPEDYHGPSVPAQLQQGKSTVVTLTSDRNFHFWPTGLRAGIGDTFGGVVAGFEARLLKPRSGRCAIVGAGGDFWRNRYVREGEGNIVDAGVGRLKRVDGRWRAFTMTTLGPAAFRRHPLTLDLRTSSLR